MPAMKKTREQLKTELRAQLEEAIERVLDWQEAHPRFTLAELEDFVLALRREMGEEIAGALVGQLGSKVVVEGVACEQCGTLMVYKGVGEKRIESRAGGLKVERGRYWCPDCQAGLFPPG
jgi:hypothetical protein